MSGWIEVLRQKTYYLLQFINKPVAFTALSPLKLFIRLFHFLPRSKSKTLFKQFNPLQGRSENSVFAMEISVPVLYKINGRGFLNALPEKWDPTGCEELRLKCCQYILKRDFYRKYEKSILETTFKYAQVFSVSLALNGNTRRLRAGYKIPRAKPWTL